MPALGQPSCLECSVRTKATVRGNSSGKANSSEAALGEHLLRRSRCLMSAASPQSSAGSSAKRAAVCGCHPPGKSAPTRSLARMCDAPHNLSVLANSNEDQDAEYARVLVQGCSKTSSG